jgi:hypothetical protein
MLEKGRSLLDRRRWGNRHADELAAPDGELDQPRGFAPIDELIDVSKTLIVAEGQPREGVHLTLGDERAKF